MQLGVMTPMWPPGANARPPAVSSTYGAPAPQARNSARSGRRSPKPRRANSGSSKQPGDAEPQRRDVPGVERVARHRQLRDRRKAAPDQRSHGAEGGACERRGRGRLANRRAPVDAAFEALQRLDRGGVVERQVLHQQHAADAARGVDPELGVEDSGPAHAARRARERVAVRARDLEAEAELVAAGAERKRLAERGQRRRLLLDEAWRRCGSRPSARRSLRSRGACRSARGRCSGTAG